MLQGWGCRELFVACGGKVVACSELVAGCGGSVAASGEFVVSCGGLPVPWSVLGLSLHVRVEGEPGADTPFGAMDEKFHFGNTARRQRGHGSVAGQQRGEQPHVEPHGGE